MRNDRRMTILTAVLALLLLGIGAGLGPGHHTCHLSTPPPASDSGHSMAPESAHRDANGGLCEACLLSAQLRALGLAVTSGLLPPPPATAELADRPVTVTRIALSAAATRAPPLA